MLYEKFQQKPVEHISESSLEYQENRESKMERIPDGVEVFGEDFIKDVEFWRECIGDVESYIRIVESKSNKELLLRHAENLKKFSERLKLSYKKFREELIKKFSDGEGSDYGFLEEIVGIPGIRKIIQNEREKHENGLEKLSDIDIAHKIIMDGHIPDEILEEMARNHISIYEKHQEELAEELPDMIADFKEAVLQAINAGYLPISKDVLEARINETRVFLADNMMLYKDSCGDYSVWSASIRVAQRPNRIDQRKILFHEMVHALSGRTITKEARSSEPDGIEYQRLGLTFSSYDKKGEFLSKIFTWLNEAVTEEIASFLAKEGEESYVMERYNLNQWFYANGIPREMVYKAYFENYDPDSQEKVPAWKELTKKLAETYKGSSFPLLRIIDRLRGYKTDVQKT